MQRYFGNLILVSPIIQNFGRQIFFFHIAAKNDRILHKNDCERKLFYIVNENDT